MLIGSANSVLHHLSMVNVNVERVFSGRISFSIFRKHFPNDVRHQQAEATGVAADGLGQLRIVILNVIEVDRQRNLMEECLRM